MKSLRLLALVLVAFSLSLPAAEQSARPNILFAISDDQSWLHASAYGYKAVSTPAFDRVAKSGVLFRNAFGASPGCSPCRAAFLTGRHTWMIEHAGTHASSFSRKYAVYPEALGNAGYFVGLTGKGWGPGNVKVDNWPHNPAGPVFKKHSNKPPFSGINQNDYAANFADFLKQKPKDKPFCFWFGGSEPHRAFEKGSGLKAGKKIEDVVVPPFLPDTPEIRSDILDYLVEIEWFNEHLGRILKTLEDAGELDNTLVIVTSDNGMAFPRAKANCYEYGIHMPLAISWPKRVPGNRVVDDLVGFVDLTATIYEATGVAHPSKEFPLAGKSIMNILTSTRQGVVDPSRQYVYSARERHSSSRYDNLSYPQRCVRTPEFLYIRNFAPDRWPAGAPQALKEDGTPGPMHGAYHDIDGGPSLSFMVEHREDPNVKKFFHLAVDKRPAEELYDTKKDPGCLNNLAGNPQYSATQKKLGDHLLAYLKQTGDARVLGNGDIWETYPRYSPIRKFPKE
ncbi:MAG: sulfatase [Verrucomicrobiota bacterium]